MKILLVHNGANESSTQWHESIAETAPENMDIQCFPLAIPGFKHRIDWQTLDLAWRCRHPGLMNMYGRLHMAAQDADVLLLYGGYNLHPGFLDSLPTFNAFCFYDDPESSDKCSRYVASAFDGVFYCNVASRLQYEDWGCRRTAFLPIFTAPRDIPQPHEKEGLLTTPRDNDIILCCAWNGGEWRQRRLGKITAAFPQARCFGKGWPGEFVPDEELRNLYGRSRIGWNIHNSTGPINVRLFSLPAWNILQICDNKTGLAEVFELGREVVGFDTISEAIEATHYYLSHEDESRAIARRGHERYWNDYSPTALWGRIANQIRDWRSDLPSRPRKPAIEIRSAPAWQYQIHALPHTIGRTLRRWQTSLRKRSADVTRPIDERYYLSEEVSYQAGVHITRKPRSCSRRESGNNQELEGAALAWAASTMIGKARSILVLGDGSETGHFASFAKRDPERQVYLGTDKKTGKQSSNDLVVVFNSSIDTALEQIKPEVSAEAYPLRIILGYISKQVTMEGGTDALYTQLEKTLEDVRCYWLPNAVVPWIEPLPGSLANITLLVAGTLQTLEV